MTRAQAYLSQYRDVGLAGSVADASPHKLVALLLRGARERIQSAIVSIDRGDIPRKAKDINQYGGQRLVEANAANDTKRLTEVDTLLETIESAWMQIPQGAQN